MDIPKTYRITVIAVSVAFLFEISLGYVGLESMWLGNVVHISFVFVGAAERSTVLYRVLCAAKCLNTQHRRVLFRRCGTSDWLAWPLCSGINLLGAAECSVQNSTRTATCLNIAQEI